jgi:hypothetical protein
MDDIPMDGANKGSATCTEMGHVGLVSHFPVGGTDGDADCPSYRMQLLLCSKHIFPSKIWNIQEERAIFAGRSVFDPYNL